jgi:hypothetical protein
MDQGDEQALLAGMGGLPSDAGEQQRTRGDV